MHYDSYLEADERVQIVMTNWTVMINRNFIEYFDYLNDTLIGKPKQMQDPFITEVDIRHMKEILLFLDGKLSI